MVNLFKNTITSFSSSSVPLLLLLQQIQLGNSCEHGKISANPEDCSTYLHCNHNTNLVRPCPAGLHFNPAISACDWPNNAKCTSGGGGNHGGAPSHPTTGSGTDNSWSSSPTQLPPPPSEFPDTPVHFAPYFDMTLNGPRLTEASSESGQKDFILAFAVGSWGGCQPKWGGVADINDPGILGPVRKIQASGGTFCAGTGGANGPHFESMCSNVEDLAKAYKTVLDAVGTNQIDLAIHTKLDFDRMNKALAKVQSDRPNTLVSLTLRVKTEEDGLHQELGVDILNNVKVNGVQVTFVNILTMEFWGPTQDFGDAVIAVAKSVLRQLSQIWPEKSEEQLKSMLGVTPMIGKDFHGRIFTLEHAKKLVDWANENKLGFLSMWSTARDNGKCAGGGVSPLCSSIDQNNYEFIKTFKNFKR